jgi:hypothetical protein
MDKTYTAPSGDKHDYLSIAPYWHPKDGVLEHLLTGETTKVRRDGERWPGSVVGDTHSADFDRAPWWYVASNATVLTLAWLVTDDVKYTDHAAELLRVFFLNKDTRMNPAHGVEYAQVNGGGPYGVLDTKDFYFVLDTARFVCESGSLSVPECNELRAWTRVFGKWLLNSDMALKARARKNNHGVLYEVQLLSVLAFGFDTDVVKDDLRGIQERLLMRLRKTFDCDGGQPLERGRTKSLHYVSPPSFVVGKFYSAFDLLVVVSLRCLACLAHFGIEYRLREHVDVYTYSRGMCCMPRTTF